MKLLYALIAAFIVLGGSFAYANAASIFQVIQGGTGWSNIQTGAIPYGQGTSRFATTTQGTGGFVLGWANGIPTWVATSSIQNITLTTTGTSGASTLTGNTLNIPQYAGTTYTATYPVTLSGTAFGIAFGTTTANTWSDTQTFSKAINVTEGTTATSTFSGNARVIGNLQVDGKFFAPVTLVTTGDTTINGALTVTGATTLATSLTGFLKGTSGLVSAVSSLVPGDISLTKGNFLVGNDAGVAQATSSIFIGSTGRVGIGTTTPGNTLQVEGSTGFTVKNGTADAFEFIPGGAVALAKWYGTTRFSISNDPTIANVGNGLAGNELLTVLTNGKVGIGTTAPGSDLEIYGATPYLTLNSSNGTAADAEIVIQRGGAPKWA